VNVSIVYEYKLSVLLKHVGLIDNML